MVADIEIPEKIVCLGVSTFNGRKTRQKPKVAVDYFIEIQR